ncbi:hypothetical protein HanRHA438_Chr17g0795611 [Helianthus annuus]|nr:hypothetical protein HanIR_Chr17g0852231 [Helianthus annuus]KAJ0824734.1 hypothetical protein HanRHA438_Chr17g0795611 [Helianthus annuus]
MLINLPINAIKHNTKTFSKQIKYVKHISQEFKTKFWCCLFFLREKVCSLRTTSAGICRRRGGPNVCSLQGEEGLFFLYIKPLLTLNTHNTHLSDLSICLPLPPQPPSTTTTTTNHHHFSHHPPRRSHHHPVATTTTT